MGTDVDKSLEKKSDPGNMSPAPGVPNVEVVEGGNAKKTSQDRIDPNVAMFIMQAAQTAQLVKMRKLEESKIPIGIRNISITVTDTVQSLILHPHWISFSLRNDGPDKVTVWINDEMDPLIGGIVERYDMFDSDMGYPVIEQLHLVADDGGTADVRIYAKEGRMR